MAFVADVMAALVWDGDFIRIRVADRSTHAVLVKGVCLANESQVNIGVEFADGTPVNLQFRKTDMIARYLSTPADWQDLKKD